LVLLHGCFSCSWPIGETLTVTLVITSACNDCCGCYTWPYGCFGSLEKRQLNDVVPNKGSFFRVAIGFIVGLLLPCLLTALALLIGHVQFVLSPDVTLAAVLSTLLLYLIASCREELVFRAYPLRTLNYAFGP
jgi:membrane protease YdiL (CAAX protease family)